MARESVVNIVHDPEKFAGRQIKLCGWVRTLRASKTVGFIELNDGSCMENVQIVFGPGTLEPKPSTGAAIEVTGEVRLTPDAPQPFEIAADGIMIIGDCPPEYPLQKKRHSFEFLRSMPHLRMRTNTLGAVFRLRSLCAFAVHRFFMERGFVHVHTPILTARDCEGAGALFSVTALDFDGLMRSGVKEVDYGEDFFQTRASLTVSGQLDAEAFALCYGRVYTFGPTFRAERSNTARHAAEFWMVEPEMAFADLHDDMHLAEEMIKFLIGDALEKAPKEMEFFDRFIQNGLIGRLEGILRSDFERITYTRAIEILEASGKTFEYPVSWGCDLQTEHERYLTEEVFKRPVFVTGYPKDIKAFYMRANDDGRTVAAMDLLVPGVGEIIGGSQREEREDVLLSRMQDMGMDPKAYKGYLDLRRFGGAPHAGFGLGFERMLLYLTGMKNIRDVIPYPRTPGCIDS
ncbi:MAG: asparagine--tRNA ligase [Bacillota bacterium]